MGDVLTIADAAELGAIADAMRAVTDAEATAQRVAQVADGPDDYDAALWQTLASDIGATGVLVPEEHGGLGLGWRETRVVLAELGRTLACVPFLTSCVLAPTVLLRSGDSGVAAELLPGIADGSTIVSVAVSDPSLLGPAPSSRVSARASDKSGWLLSGAVPFVAYGGVANHVLVLASRDDGRHAWFLVGTGDAGVLARAQRVVDATRPQSVLSLDSAAAGVVGSWASCTSLLEPVLDAAVTAAACEQSAASRHLLELTVAYVSSRYQFGQPVGSFQAVQHRLADLAVLVDTSTSAVEYAVWAAADAPERLPEAAAIAGFVCSETLHTAALEAIQLHGGIGFTWEHPSHRYFRRALASRAQFGLPSFHRERLLRSLGL